jgi:hypothetical protein
MKKHSTVATQRKQNFSAKKLTVGMDLGDRFSYYCVLDARQSSKVGAVCGSAARTVLCGGRSVMIVPTATLRKTH